MSISAPRAQAQVLFSQAADTCRRAESLLGASLAGQQRFTEAEALLLEGYQGMTARKDLIAMPDRHYPDLSHQYQWVVQLYEAWGKPDMAAEWKKGTD